MSETPLESLIAICDGFNLLIPAAAVAEVVSGVASEFIQDTERPWLRGQLRWRGQSIPLINIEQQILGRQPRLRGPYVAVVYGTEDPKKLPYYGITIQALPHQVQIQNNEELTTRSKQEYQNVLIATTLRGIATVIPDFQSIEKAILADKVQLTEA